MPVHEGCYMLLKPATHAGSGSDSLEGQRMILLARASTQESHASHKYHAIGEPRTAEGRRKEPYCTHDHVREIGKADALKDHIL